MPDFRETESETVYFSGKQAEEIGFGKFHARQAKLRGIHVLVLDRMRIQNRSSSPDVDEAIAEICAEIAELDLSCNLFESFDEITRLCALLPKLKVLTLDGNRMSYDRLTTLQNLKTISLNNTLIGESEAEDLLGHCPFLVHLSLSNNEYNHPLSLRLPPKLTTLDLAGNDFNYLSDVQDAISSQPTLGTLILKQNQITAVSPDSTSGLSFSIYELDLSYNKISSFSFVDALNPTSFSALRHLRLTGNPLYQNLVSPDGKVLTLADGHILTVARLPQLEFLNYSKVTEKERLNAETYYLGQIAVEISNAPEGAEANVVSRHWRYRELCEEYGEPQISRQARKDEVNPNSLVARLVRIQFTCEESLVSSSGDRSWVEELPKSLSIYALLGIVGKRMRQMPFDLRLVLETTEQDPTEMRDTYTGPEWWDSSDEDADGDGEDEWTKREVELTASTRALATYVDGRAAHVRVERRNKEL